MPVTGSRDTFFGGPAFPTHQQVHEALVATLDKTGILAGVSSSFSAGDLGGAARTVSANEGAVRENLKAFVQGVRERWRP